MYTHPGNPEHIMQTYRRHVIHSKRKFGSSRSIVHRTGYIQEYLEAKREVLKTRGPRPLK